MATIFCRLVTDEAREAYWSQTNPYSDVASGDWYNNAISTLTSMGILDGYPDGTFRPTEPITRSEFTKIAVSFFEFTEGDLTYDGRFSDVEGTEWYVTFLAAAVEYGLIEGMPDGPYLTANPLVCDITTALFAACGSLAGYYSMLQTGKGQVIDASMYESAAYLMSYHWCEQLNGGGNYKRTGPLNPLWRPFGYYECRDGTWVSVGVWGLGIWKKFFDLMGVSPADLPYIATCGHGTPDHLTCAPLRAIY